MAISSGVGSIPLDRDPPPTRDLDDDGVSLGLGGFAAGVACGLALNHQDGDREEDQEEPEGARGRNDRGDLQRG